MPDFAQLDPIQITVANFNPARRVNRSQLGGLLISIQRHGILEPLALTRDKVLADGHRRLACAKLIGMKQVPVAIHSELDLDAPALWVVLNAESLSLTPSQWLDAVAHGLPLETPGFPESLKRRIERLKDLIGDDAIAELVEAGRSPNIMDSAERVAKYCDKKGDETFLKKTIFWMMGTGNPFSVRAAMEEEIPGDMLIEAIESGHSLQRVWDIAR